eukprot:CAMPEP_0197640998 /NCGR_PEP_ID=MMETSP1338-20131121/15094_1 /TAXON_ID=43686 ORGANISM="Pelagodinium beii, Strain RCC1491" /NCGR_SAMPLE_ID=MMETSP1338 /ASSEMBLY_ACC=CAM_ASM_000754 /LENGTH=124 /DNA_ID=CAMNT_0043213897 /DNA_START=78 /DNA_END=449 /DNA_ORIENTATION=+
MSPKSLDLAEIDKVVAKWNAAKKREQEAHKEIEACKTQIEAAMMKTGTDVLTTSQFEVTKRTQSREGVSKKDVPAGIWEQYCKTSTFVVLACKELKGGKAPASPSKASPKAKAKGKAKAKPTKK